MVPDLDLQLGVIEAALRNIASQSGAGGGLAAEQLHLSLATLHMVRTLLPLQLVSARHELETALEMARAAELPQFVAAGEALLARSGATAGQIDALRAGLLAAIAALVDAEPPPGLRAAILQHSRAALDIARACCLPAGFESDPDERKRLAEVRAALFAEAEIPTNT